MPSFKSLKSKAPKSQIFLRGFMEEMGNTNVLRECGSAGKSAAEEAGFDIEDREISRLSRDLTKLGVVVKVRKGRHFIVEPGDHYDDFVKWMDQNKDWGTKPDDDPGINFRLEAYERVVEGGESIRSSEDNRIPYEAFGLLMKKANEGELDLVFTPAGSDLRVVRRDENGKNQAVRVGTWA